MLFVKPQRRFDETVGVSILTNGSRRHWLERCISALLEHCFYRPLLIAIYNNGSIDDTMDWSSMLPETQGVTWMSYHAEKDGGCAKGTNESIALLKGCKYHLHLESDFIHMPKYQSGADKFWLHRAINFMEKEECDYLYLRRMENEQDMFNHWWSQWMLKLQGDGEFMKCPDFWWSNNPALFRYQAMIDAETLPLDESLDGPKGSHGWSRPEIKAKRPPNAYVHQWGMFAHECKGVRYPEITGCGKFPTVGTSTCKYGFYKDGKDRFCQVCDLSKGREDMPSHESRFRQILRMQK